MKSWPARIGVSLAVGAAAVAIPLTATTASATPPPGKGWVTAGAERFPSKKVCEEKELPHAKANGYKEVWCDGEGGYTSYTVYYR
jgi:hypothetical protein